MSIADWHAYISGAPSFTAAQDRIEEAVAEGVDFVALNAHAEGRVI